MRFFFFFFEDHLFGNNGVECEKRERTKKGDGCAAHEHICKKKKKKQKDSLKPEKVTKKSLRDLK